MVVESCAVCFEVNYSLYFLERDVIMLRSTFALLSCKKFARQGENGEKPVISFQGHAMRLFDLRESGELSESERLIA